MIKNFFRSDPYKVIMKKTGLPVTLLSENKVERRANRSHLLQTETFGSTFGKSATRKRPRISTSNLTEMAAAAGAANDSYDASNDR